MVGRQLERLFADRYAVLAFRRTEHSKSRQGDVSMRNLVFGVRYIVVSCLRLVRARPRTLYVDVPKDRLSFLRTSVVLLTARALRVRVVGDLAGADFPFLEGRSLTARYARWVLRHVGVIRVLGSSIAEALSARGLANTSVLSNGIEEPPGGGRRREFPTGDRRLLYVGKVAVSKGIFALVEAMAASVAEEPGWRLEVVGEWEGSETRERVLAAVAAARIEDRIVFRGLLTGAEKWDAYRGAHLLVHPSTWDGQPVTILEAFATGLPVVATRVGAIPDTVSHGVDGRLLSDGGAATLVAAIRNVLADPEAYLEMCGAARKAYEAKFTETVFANGMAALLEEVAGRA